ncbi:serine/threonine-protein kinase Nek10 isoform X1 [Babesia caballi]|uniref:Serine/threonine-protein kinase Nek10 isoform X1 n=1 Tax=Babesia caballi TaxID=5871 RepID=A0AAV4LZZ1_BABCB|nr:serine/threonine-protein kinase Nek10 isoform X1 [Babesia caballi]
MVRLLFWMTLNQEYNELIEPELESLAELCGIPPEEFKLSHHRDEDAQCDAQFGDDGYYLKFDDYYSALVRGQEVEDRRVKKSQQNVFYYATVPSLDTAFNMFDRSIQIKAVIDVGYLQLGLTVAGMDRRTELCRDTARNTKATWGKGGENTCGQTLVR